MDAKINHKIALIFQGKCNFKELIGIQMDSVQKDFMIDKDIKKIVQNVQQIVNSVKMKNNVKLAMKIILYSLINKYALKNVMQAINLMKLNRNAKDAFKLWVEIVFFNVLNSLNRMKKQANVYIYKKKRQI